MNLTNVVGKKTQNYINKLNELKGKQNMATTTKTTKTVKSETPMNHFKRIANGRLHRALYAIELIGNCIGDGYEHTPEQENIIEAKILEQLQKTLNNLNNPKAAAVKKQPMLL